MGEALHFRAGDIGFESYGGPPGSATIARLIGPDQSRTMGGGPASSDLVLHPDGTVTATTAAPDVGTV